MLLELQQPYCEHFPYRNLIQIFKVNRMPAFPLGIHLPSYIAENLFSF